MNIESEELNDLNDSEKVEFLVSWFRKNFADPAEEMPWIEGEYFYPYGGPYSAASEFRNASKNQVPEELIKQAAAIVEVNGVFEWAPSRSHPDHSNQIAEVGDPVAEYYEWLERRSLRSESKAALSELRELLAKQRSMELGTLQLRMLFIQCWAILEAFLSGTLMKCAKNDPQVLSRLYQGLSALRDHQFKGGDLARNPNFLLDTALAYLRRVSFHDPMRMRTFVECAFGNFKSIGIDCDQDIAVFESLESKRHDCVHRNGKTLEGQLCTLSHEEVLRMCEAVSRFIGCVGELAGDYDDYYDFEDFLS